MRAVDLTWPGGEHAFLLNIELLRALQDKCDAGPAHVLARLGAQQWFVDDVIEPIRLGLEGGGMDKRAARDLVKKHVEGEPLSMFVLTAQAILMAALYGSDDDTVGEPLAGETDQNLSREAESAGPDSTDGALSSASVRQR